MVKPSANERPRFRGVLELLMAMQGHAIDNDGQAQVTCRWARRPRTIALFLSVQVDLATSA